MVVAKEAVVAKPGKCVIIVAVRAISLVPGGGAKGQDPNRGNRSGGGNQQGKGFPGVDNAGIRNPPRPGEPCERVLPSGQEVKWRGLCGKWGDDYRTGHPAEEELKEEEVVYGDDLIAIKDGKAEETDDPP